MAWVCGFAEKRKPEKFFCDWYFLRINMLQYYTKFKIFGIKQLFNKIGLTNQKYCCIIMKHLNKPL